jgi:hypothetical protein
MCSNRAATRVNLLNTREKQYTRNTCVCSYFANSGKAQQSVTPPSLPATPEAKKLAWLTMVLSFALMHPSAWNRGFAEIGPGPVAHGVLVYRQGSHY